MKLDLLTYEDVNKLDFSKAVLSIPIGSMEAHGPHLPIGSDLIQPIALLENIEKVMPNLIIAPPIPYGVCYFTEIFKGTIGISHDSLRNVVYELMESSISTGFKYFLILSGHAASYHLSALREASYEIIKKYKEIKIAVLSDYEIAYKLRMNNIPTDDGHGGLIETSRVMAINKNYVKILPNENHSKIKQFIISNENLYAWKMPYEGDPSKATIELGKSINEYVEKELINLIKSLLGN
jgi:creatinine amidohydrolase